jgi:hypothetical protein
MRSGRTQLIQKAYRRWERRRDRARERGNAADLEVATRRLEALSCLLSDSNRKDFLAQDLARAGGGYDYRVDS